jgi:hypothetical protein
MKFARTPEEAARGEIPEPYARVLGTAMSPDGNNAVVLLGTNEPPRLYPYQVVCERREQGWVEEIGGNGPGCSTTSSENEPNVGVATLWDEAPPGATAAVVSFLGHDTEVPWRTAISSSPPGTYRPKTSASQSSWAGSPRHSGSNRRCGR